MFLHSDYDYYVSYNIIGKKQPSALDVISKWEDMPNESSNIQLVGVKLTGDGEVGDNEKPSNGGAEKDGEETKKDEKTSEKEVKEGSKDDGGITLETFGFPEVVVEPTAPKAENPTSKSEGKEDADKKEQEEKELTAQGESTKVKAGDELATNSGESPTSVSLAYKQLHALDSQYFFF